MTNPLDFIHSMAWEDLDSALQKQTELALLDLIGVAAAGMKTRASAYVRELASEEFGGPYPMLFDGRTASLTGGALAAGCTIDSIDAHPRSTPLKTKGGGNHDLTHLFREFTTRESTPSVQVVQIDLLFEVTF